MPEEPIVEPFLPIQNGLVRWRQRGPRDDWNDDDDHVGWATTDYDVLADG